MLRTTSGVARISLLRCRQAQADATRVKVLSAAAVTSTSDSAAC